MKTFNEILPQFLADIKIQLKERSYQGYVSKTKVFSQWLKDNNLDEFAICELQISNSQKSNIADFFIYLATERGLDRPTCHKYFLVLRRVFQYARKKGLITDVPFDNESITLPKKKADMSSEVISSDHMKVLLSVIKKKDPQLYLAAMTEYYCFLRPGTELRLLKVKDIDFKSGTIQVSQEHAKNGHKRTVTVPSQLFEIMEELGIDKADKNFYVFGNTKKPGTRPCSVNMLRYRFNKYRDKLGLSKGYKLYSLKHTGVTALHNSNMVSLRGLMDQIGHLRLSSTEHYIKKHVGFVNEKIRDNFPDPY